MDEQRRYDGEPDPPRYPGSSSYDSGPYQRPADPAGAFSFGAVPEPPDDIPALPSRSALDAIRVPLRPTDYPAARPGGVAEPGSPTGVGTPPVPSSREPAGHGPSGAMRPDALRLDANRPDAVRPDAIRSDGLRSDALRPETMRTEPIRVDAARQDPMRVGPPARHDASAFAPTGVPAPGGPGPDRQPGDWRAGDRHPGDWRVGDRQAVEPYPADRQPGDWQAGEPYPADRHAAEQYPGERHAGDRVASRRGGDTVYRTRRPVSAVVFAVVTALLLVPVVRLLVDAGLAADPGARGIVPAVLMTLGLPLTGVGLYGVAGAGGVMDRQVFLRPPAGYLPVGLILLVAAGLAVA